MTKKTKNIIGVVGCVLCLAAIAGVTSALAINLDKDKPINPDLIDIDNFSAIEKLYLNSNENVNSDVEVKTTSTSYKIDLKIEPTNANNYDFIFNTSSEYLSVVEDEDGLGCTVTALTQFKNPAYLNIKEVNTNQINTIEINYENYNEEKIDLVVCYYFDGIEDIDKRLKLTCENNEVVDPNNFLEEHEGYTFDSISGSVDELKSFNITESSVINFNYLSNKIDLTCEYYKDGNLDSTLTDIYHLEKNTKIYVESFKKAIEGYIFDSANISGDFNLVKNTTLKLYYLKNEITEPGGSEEPGKDPVDPGEEVTYKVSGSASGTYKNQNTSVVGHLSGNFKVEGYSGLVYLSFDNTFSSTKSTAISISDGVEYSFTDELMQTGMSGNSGFAGGNFNTNGGEIYVYTSGGIKIGSFKYSLTELSVAYEVSGNLVGSYFASGSNASGSLFNGQITIEGYSGDVYLSFEDTFNSSKSSKITVTDGIPFNIANESATSGMAGSSGFAGGNFNTNGGELYVYIGGEKIGSISYTMNAVTCSGSGEATFHTGTSYVGGTFKGKVTVNGFTGTIYLSTQSIFDFSNCSTLSVNSNVVKNINESFQSGMAGSSGFAGGALNVNGGTIYIYLSSGAKIGSFTYTAIQE